MNCVWRDIPDSRDNRGWRRVECVRCGRKLNHTPHIHTDIHASCPAFPWWHEAGFWIELLLKALGITKDRYNWLRRRVGIKKPCGCPQNQEAMNKSGHKLALFLGRIFSGLRKKLFWFLSAIRSWWSGDGLSD